MIITLTSNPSVDYYMVTSEKLQPGVQRVDHAYCLPGGKGLNVSLILHQFSIPSVATSFLGGFTGRYIAQALASYQYVTLDSVNIPDDNRINVKFCGEQEFDINSPGPVILRHYQTEMLKLLRSKLSEHDWMIVSGSFAPGMKEDFLLELSELVHFKNAYLVLDIPNMYADLLAQTRPFLIKPNVEELHFMFRDPERNYSVQEMCRSLQNKGIFNILLSNGEKGALLYTKHHIYFAEHPCLKCVSSTGAGDSMLAAFVGMLSKNCKKEEALAWAAAAGGATAISPRLADLQAIQQIKNTIIISTQDQNTLVW